MPQVARFSNIDLLRGIVMIIMALDHTRDFFHITAFTADPLDLATTTPALFFTRWITHFCAPVFVFLSGASAFFQSLRKTKSSLSIFLIKRGLWLIAVELLIITLGMTFDITYSLLIFQVIWAIGISMVILGILVRLPFYAILAIGLLIVAGHNSLDFYETGNPAMLPSWYQVLHRQFNLPVNSHTTLIIFYPFLPWTGVMLLGYCFGKFYSGDASLRNNRAITTGVALTILFILLRFIDIYGDPLHWSQQKNIFCIL